MGRIPQYLANPAIFYSRPNRVLRICKKPLDDDP